MRLNENFNQFHYGYAKLRDLKTYGIRSTNTGRVTITGIEIKGQLFAPSLCFWRSFFHRFDVPTRVLQFFEPSEIFDRVQRRDGNTKIRYCVQKEPNGSATIMVVCAAGSG